MAVTAVCFRTAYGGEAHAMNVGGSLALLLRAVKEWAETHFDEVQEPRARHDAQSEPQSRPRS